MSEPDNGPNVYDPGAAAQLAKLRSKSPNQILGRIPTGASSWGAGSVSSTVTSPTMTGCNVRIQLVGVGGIEIHQPQQYGNNVVVVDLSGIHKLMPRFNGAITCTAPVSHLLGLLLIDGVTHINIDNGGKIDAIMNKYLGTRDILSAQDELLDAGRKDYARL
jgi:hypothetical protein